PDGVPRVLRAADGERRVAHLLLLDGDDEVGREAEGGVVEVVAAPGAVAGGGVDVRRVGAGEAGGGAGPDGPGLVDEHGEGDEPVLLDALVEGGVDEVVGDVRPDEVG